MERYKEFVKGSRKVICDVVTSKFSNVLENRLSFYEDGNLVIRLLPKEDFVYYDDSKFKTRRYANLIDIFLTKGIADLKFQEIENIVKSIRITHNTIACDIIFCFGDRFQIVLIDPNSSGQIPFYHISMKVNDKKIILENNYFQFRDEKYSTIAGMTKEEMFTLYKNCCDIYGVHKYYDNIEDESMVILTDYGCEFIIYADTYRRMLKTKYLSSVNFLETGHLFILRPEDIKKIAKMKLLGIKLKIKYVDKEKIVF